MSKKSFAERVYQKCSLIPKGKVSTYKQIALSLDCNAYRAVGTALGSNPYAPIVPCHRVVNSDGRLGGYNSGLIKKIELLKSEGIQIDEQNKKVYNFKQYLFIF